MLGGPRIRSGRRGEIKNFSPLLVFEPSIVQPLASLIYYAIRAQTLHVVDHVLSCLAQEHFHRLLYSEVLFRHMNNSVMCLFAAIFWPAMQLILLL